MRDESTLAMNLCLQRRNDRAISAVGLLEKYFMILVRSSMLGLRVFLAGRGKRSRGVAREYNKKVPSPVIFQ